MPEIGRRLFQIEIIQQVIHSVKTIEKLRKQDNELNINIDNLKNKFYTIKKMKFNVNQQDLQKSLNYCQGVIEKRSTLPILSNVLLDVANSKLTITATDLDLIFIHQIDNVEIIEEGKNNIISSIMYDIIRKFSSGKKINFSLSGENKLTTWNQKNLFFILNCINASEFPLTDENFNQNEFSN